MMYSHLYHLFIHIFFTHLEGQEHDSRWSFKSWNKVGLGTWLITKHQKGIASEYVHEGYLICYSFLIVSCINMGTYAD
jgi:hypothetical protein